MTRGGRPYLGPSLPPDEGSHFFGAIFTGNQACCRAVAAVCRRAGSHFTCTSLAFTPSPSSPFETNCVNHAVGISQQLVPPPAFHRLEHIWADGLPPQCVRSVWPDGGAGGGRRPSHRVPVAFVPRQLVCGREAVRHCRAQVEVRSLLKSEKMIT